jgi:hypothetical protein
MENQYLIPANTKRGQLIFSMFRPVDLGIFLTGLTVTFITLIVLSNTGNNVIYTVLACVPAVVCTGLVVPIPNYHNVLVALQEVIAFYSNNRRYKWRGWCAVYESTREQ